MQQLKRAMTALSLVAAMVLAVPSTLGGGASAAVGSSEHHNPNLVATTFHCDLDKNGSYETDYKLTSTESSTMWQVKDSTLVIVQRVRLDVLESDYTLEEYQGDDGAYTHDPTGTAVPFHDATGYWFTSQGYTVGSKDKPKDQPKGWKTVRCIERVSYAYAPYASDVALNAEFGLSFVQSPDCPEDAPVLRESLPECVTYLETDTNLYDVTFSPGRQGSAQAAARTTTSKHASGGKHRGKGKHRR